jgi:gas vesicle protein
MEVSEMNETAKGVTVFALGVALGAAAGVLYAPRSGKHTRARLRKTAHQTHRKIQDLRDDVKLHMNEWVDEASDAIASSIASGKAKANASGEYVSNVLASVRNQMEAGRQRVEHFVRSMAS